MSSNSDNPLPSSSGGGNPIESHQNVPTTSASASASASSPTYDPSGEMSAGCTSQRQVETAAPSGIGGGGAAAGGGRIAYSGRTARVEASNPVRKLTVALLDTYKRVNEVYYARKQAKQAAEAQKKIDAGASGGGVAVAGGKARSVFDDEHGDYIIRSGDIFKDRYQIQDAKPLGKGSFGQVVRVYDTVGKTYLAMKIIKNKRAFHEQAQVEIQMLTLFKNFGETVLNHRCIVRMLDCFVYRNHQCIVTELLNLSLYDLLKRTKLTGVSLNLVKKFAFQMLLTLEFLLEPGVNVVHCDMKPENVLLRNASSCAIKVIDFGSSCKVNERIYTYIQSRFYRSPEVIMNLPYDQSIDMWSLGCIMLEMHSGQPLFNGHNEPEQICKIVETLGMLPKHMIEGAGKSCKVKSLFVKNEKTGEYDLIYRGRAIIPLSRPLDTVIGVTTGGPGGRRINDPGHTEGHYSIFADLLRMTLRLDPAERCKPALALQHRFFAMPASSGRADRDGESARSPSPGSAGGGGRSSAGAARGGGSADGGGGSAGAGGKSSAGRDQ